MYAKRYQLNSYIFIFLNHHRFPNEFQPGAIEATPFIWPDVDTIDLKNAEILLDYGGLIRNELLSRDTTCSSVKLRFFDLIQYTECVPAKQSRCPSREMKCNPNEM